jgi:hypothetical protein
MLGGLVIGSKGDERGGREDDEILLILLIVFVRLLANHGRVQICF